MHAGRLSGEYMCEVFSYFANGFYYVNNCVKDHLAFCETQSLLVGVVRTCEKFSYMRILGQHSNNDKTELIFPLLLVKVKLR